MLLTIAVTIAVLAVLILVHELGHYIAARAFDIRVPRFSIGFGPKVVGIQRGETEFRIGLLPLGGYVKLAGLDELSVLEGASDEEAGSADPERSFQSKAPLARAIVLAAGVTMNGVVAVALFALIALVWGAPEPSGPVVADVVEEWVPESASGLAAIDPGSRVTRVGGHDVATMDDVSRRLMRAPAGPITLEFARHDPVTIRIPEEPRERRMLPVALSPVEEIPPVVGKVVEGGAADAAGLESGDSIIALDGRPVRDWQTVARAAENRPGQPLALDVRRGDDIVRVQVTPESTRTAVATVGRIQASPDRTATHTPRSRLGPAASVRWGFQQSWRVIVLVGDFFAGLVQGRYSALDMGGPFLIGQLSGAAARAGVPVLLFFVALLSINLAVINLLPIPALDGGQLVMLAVETVRGRPASERTRRFLGQLGVTLVAAIMIWAVAADLLRLLG